jgi:UDP-N-acetylmuramoyl-L-alanyl-D-glutamate--2,6-diaminopimelate ligase
MLLSELLSGFTKQSIADINIEAMSLDSRSVKAGALFISVAKNAEARLGYLQQAINNGATVVLTESLNAITPAESQLLAESGVTHYLIDDLTNHVSELAARFYDEPSKLLKVIAVTGTNGKTSVSHFIAQALAELNFTPAIIGTLGVGQLGQLIDTGMTTPDPILLQATLAEFVQQGVSHVVMEASSHALEQNRLASVAVDVAVFTNLSRDHLDYHKTMDAYGRAKQRLFEFDSVSHAVINQDDQFGQQLLSLLADKPLDVISYGQHAKIAVTDVKCELSGLTLTLAYGQQQAEVHSALLGQFNSENIAATVGALLALEIVFEDVVKAISNIEAVAGRMQSVLQDNKPHVVVDYAHTPDALNKVLASLRQHVSVNGKLWCVFGCGGDRDTGKRPLMGEVAEQLADNVVLTADNPRSESNLTIVDAILAGMKQPEAAHIEHERAQAIKYAVTHATAIDMVLVAGKGHENYQDVNGVKSPFSDIEASLHALKAANDDSQNNRELQQ